MRRVRNGSFTSNIERVETKEELLESLEKYKGILSVPMIEYLNSLLELEFSVVRENIGKQDRDALSELDIYRSVAIYNIYNRAKNLLNEMSDTLKIKGNEDGWEELSVELPLLNGTVQLYEFDYRSALSFRLKVPNDYRPSSIGQIRLYQTLEDKGKREEELSRVLTTLNKLYDEKNPYSSRPGVAGGPRPMWEMQHRQMIRDYEQQWKALEGREMLSDDEKKAIEWTNRIYDKMIEDYGLTESDFEEISKKGIPTYYELTYPNKLEKMMTKEQPGLTIVRKIKYL